MATTSQLADDVVRGDRLAIARAITLLESTRLEDQDASDQLLTLLAEKPKATLRVGITGVPGAGKSTFINALGSDILSQDASAQVAVLSIDPSSQRSGGSILGDKTRMPELAVHPRAFVRPSPSKGALGGVHDRTYDAIRIVEAAGYNIVLVETVGVGQSEIAVADLVDTVIWLALPGAGDELQGVKRGIMEVADVVCVHKADGERMQLAEQARSFLRTALHMLTGHAAEVELVSSLERQGLGATWARVVARGVDDAARLHQAQLYFDHIVKTEAQRRFMTAHRSAFQAARSNVGATPSVAAHRFLRSINAP